MGVLSWVFCGSLVVPTWLLAHVLSLVLFGQHSSCDDLTNGEKDNDNSGVSGGHGFHVNAFFPRSCFSMDAPFAANLSFLLSKTFGYRT